MREYIISIVAIGLIATIGRYVTDRKNAPKNHVRLITSLVLILVTLSPLIVYLKELPEHIQIPDYEGIEEENSTQEELFLKTGKSLICHKVEEILSSAGYKALKTDAILSYQSETNSFHLVGIYVVVDGADHQAVRDLLIYNFKCRVEVSTYNDSEAVFEKKTSRNYCITAFSCSGIVYFFTNGREEIGI